MARRTAAAARATRDAIVARAVEIGSVDGLEGITIGRLADDLGLSKSGVLNHFRTKELLQLAALSSAEEIFRREVWEPARDEPPGLRRLIALEDAWIDHVTGDAFPGGCFWTAASAEFDGRPGSVRETVADALERWYATVRREVRAAMEAGELPPGTDPEQIVFELRGVAMTTNQQVQLHNDPAARDRARAAVRHILGSIAN
ncbi:TetR/AcrR family transcriptional regulator [Conexibacter woesei]|uniref:Transcriptional regulator, TetR family n=1 Tax=Conexibacter woesei (strain DSM 14684 / CCUG 47730 / CIP 108061 / JCM 11494 / NBRC 100937 / ID131577) TaxID=469383 RepID=D3F512_CONWI|nr:TetR/AcrR family transcriptional regulator [Conexibacter woesei]ADB48590.1 transcriptional regulator, TetR family [Conexibacter woesei DSM 14684]